MPTLYRNYRPTMCDAADLSLSEQQDWYVVGVGRNRDSSLLEDCNFSCVEKHLTKVASELGSEAPQVHRFGHWACGWFELLLVEPKLLEAATIVENALSDSPVFDETAFSEAEHLESESEREKFTDLLVFNYELKENTHDYLRRNYGLTYEIYSGLDLPEYPYSTEHGMVYPYADMAENHLPSRDELAKIIREYRRRIKNEQNRS